MNSIQLPNFSLPDVSLSSLVINIVLGILLSLLLTWHYSRRCGLKILRRDLGLVLPVICLTTLLVISVVKSSLALSLGLVGALSIVRFRTPIKEPEELAYIFLSIAIGLALGADQRETALVAAPVILCMISSIDFIFKDRSSKTGNLLLSLEVQDSSKSKNLIEEIVSLIGEFCAEINVQRIDQEQNSLSIICLINSLGKEQLSKLSNSFLEKFPNGRLSIIDDHSFPNE